MLAELNDRSSWDEAALAARLESAILDSGFLAMGAQHMRLAFVIGCCDRGLCRLHYSKAKMRFQSFLMLMTIQPSFFASSYSAWVNVPTFVSGSPCAGP